MYKRQVCNPKSFDWEKIRELSQKYKLEIPMICTGEVFGQDGLTFSDTDNKRRDEAILRAMAAVDLSLIHIYRSAYGNFNCFSFISI